jgi:phospholipid/cholesterol/gamma-HCH transport system substrate-binding protein
MAQRKQLTWTELRVGLFVLAGIVLVVIGIFYITGSGTLGTKYRLVTHLPEVEGLAIGAPVTLDGLEVGNVETIGVTPVRPGQSPDPNRAIEVVMRINRNFQQYIRTDSSASQLTQGFLGNRVITVRRGYAGQVLQDGQEVPAREENGFNQIAQRGTVLMENLTALSNQIGGVVNDIHQGRGTLGKLLTDQTAYNRLNSALERVDQITASIQQGQGTIGKLINSDALYTKVDSAAERINNVIAALQDQKGALGKLIYDPTLHDSAKDFFANSDAILSDIRAGRGTLGKLANDDTLFAVWRQTGLNLRDATATLNSRDATAGKFFSDPKFYDNISGAAGDVRLLIGDFRTHPSKFLHVKFSLF